MPATSPSRLLADALAREPGRPLVTFYDDATGERTELSVATFENWVSKTANLLVDDLGAGPGTRVALLLPLHWQTSVWLAACWTVGVTVCAGGEPPDLAASADVAVCGPATLDDAAASDEVVALSLRPMGAPFGDDLPAGYVDYAADVLGHGDRFSGPDVPAVTEFDGTVLTSGALLDAARIAAGRWSLGTGGRLLTTLEPTSLAGLLAVLPAALAVDGSVVMARGYGEDALRRLAAERVTATAG